MPEQIFVVEPHSEHIGKGCPTCHRGIEVNQTVADCPICHSIHHEKCWSDQGGCGKVGCRGTASKKRNTVPSSNSAAPAAESAAAVKPVSTEANQLPMGVIYGILGVLALIIIYFVFEHR